MYLLTAKMSTGFPDECSSGSGISCSGPGKEFPESRVMRKQNISGSGQFLITGRNFPASKRFRTSRKDGMEDWRSAIDCFMLSDENRAAEPSPLCCHLFCAIRKARHMTGFYAQHE